MAEKTTDQLDLQALHRVRERFVSQRTGITNQIRSLRSALVRCSRRDAISSPGSDWCRGKSRLATVQSWVRYRSAATAIYACCSCKQPGWCS